MAQVFFRGDRYVDDVAIQYQDRNIDGVQGFFDQLDHGSALAAADVGIEDSAIDFVLGRGFDHLGGKSVCQRAVKDHGGSHIDLADDVIQRISGIQPAILPGAGVRIGNTDYSVFPAGFFHRSLKQRSGVYRYSAPGNVQGKRFPGRH